MNVIASIGSGNRLRLVTTPISGWFGCAGERGPGVAIWLALARHLAANPVADTRFIFAAFTGHELDGTGSRDFVRRHAPKPEEVEDWLALGAGIATYNYDFSGSAPVNTGGLYLGRFLMTNAESFVTPLTGPFAAIPGLTPLLTANPIGEMGYFAAQGYHVWGVGGNSEFHHQPRDLPDVTGPTILEEAARAFAAALSAIGN